MSLPTPQQKTAKKLGEVIAKSVPRGTCFALVITEFGEGGELAYVSNGSRADMIKTLEDLLEHVKAGR